MTAWTIEILRSTLELGGTPEEDMAKINWEDSRLRSDLKAWGMDQ